MSSPEQLGEDPPEDGSVVGDEERPSFEVVLNGDGVPVVEMVVIDVASDSSNCVLVGD